MSVVTRISFYCVDTTGSSGPWEQAIQTTDREARRIDDVTNRTNTSSRQYQHRSKNKDNKCWKRGCKEFCRQPTIDAGKLGYICVLNDYLFIHNTDRMISHLWQSQ